MKFLKELKGTYGSEDISRLVEFISNAPIQLPENENYYFEKVGTAVHVYCMGSDINEWNLVNQDPAANFSRIKTTADGTEISLKYEGIEKIVLHSKITRKKSPKSLTDIVDAVSPSRIRKSRLASYSTGGESNGCESRSSSVIYGESSFQAESRNYRASESRSSAESRGANSYGESRPSSESRARSSYGESRTSGESRGANSYGESRPSTESRARSSYGESRTSGESRKIGFRSNSSYGESRGGESRW